MKAHRIVYIALGIMLLAAAGSAGWAQSEGSEADVAAVVNGEQITRTALVDRLLNQTNTGQMVLAEMIGETLLTQEAAKRAISVTDEEVQARIQSIKDRMMEPDPEARFAQYLRDQNVTASGLPEKVRIKILAEKVLADRIEVSDDEVNRIYEAGKDRFDRPEQVLLSWILLKTEADAKAVIARLDQGESFADVAKEVSTDLVSRQRGGQVGVASRNDLPVEFRDPVFALAEGKYTQPIKTSSGDYAILMVNGRIPAVPHDPAAVKEQIRIERREAKLHEAWSALMTTLSQGSKIENHLQPSAPPA